MKSCCSVHCVLILLTTAFSTENVSGSPVEVKLHDSATLPCSGRCPGVARWFMSHNRTDTLAECNQTSCRSVKEGYQRIHDLYLNGDLSLTISGADFTKRGWYTADCDRKDLCDVQLKIKPLFTSVQLKSNESLVLDLDVSDPVEVIYNRTGAAGPSGQICRVEGHSVTCRDEYKDRVSVTSGLELRGLTPSDSGVYTLQDARSEELIHIYTLTVTDERRDPDPDKGAGVPVWMIVVLVLVLVLVPALVLVLLVIAALTTRNSVDLHLPESPRSFCIHFQSVQSRSPSSPATGDSRRLEATEPAL